MSSSTSLWQRAGAKRVGVWFLLLLGLLFFGGPILFLIVGAFKPGSLVLSESGSWRAFWPTEGSLDNFIEAIDRAEVLRLLGNTTVVTVGTVVAGLVVNSMIGYSLARFRFKGRRAILFTVIALTVVPFQAIAIPMMLMMAQWGLRNTYTGLIIPMVASPFYIYLFYSFFLSIPKEVEEAGVIDGAGPFRIFVSIAAPMAIPAYATVTILSFMGTWGELLWPALMTDDVSARTIQLGISIFRSRPPVDPGVVLAAALLAAIPVLVVFLILQRRFIETAARSGIK